MPPTSCSRTRTRPWPIRYWASRRWTHCNRCRSSISTGNDRRPRIRRGNTGSRRPASRGRRPGASCVIRTRVTLQAAVAGQGIALLSLALVADDLAAGHLVRPFGPAIAGRTYHLVMRTDPQPGAAARAVADWLREESGMAARP
ncbi:LysR substrate-binding domain-containing protein [Telluria antibiotica]|uniref:LysR substrate-binding domain-containing protein n=1 Tax=Telluria antibiotica TaxID=2717319 RepID=UPI00280BFCBB|nr:LysR substrate-binding domain-containing protein [Telluria antibiotica]